MEEIIMPDFTLQLVSIRKKLRTTASHQHLTRTHSFNTGHLISEKKHTSSRFCTLTQNGNFDLISTFFIKL